METYTGERRLSTRDTVELDLEAETLATFLRTAEHPSAAYAVETHDTAEYTVELVRGIDRVQYRGSCGSTYFAAELDTTSDALRYLEESDTLTIH